MITDTDTEGCLRCSVPLAELSGEAAWPTPHTYQVKQHPQAIRKLKKLLCVRRDRFACARQGFSTIGRRGR